MPEEIFQVNDVDDLLESASRRTRHQRRMKRYSPIFLF